MDKVSPLKLFDENKTVAGFNLRRLLYQQDGHAFVRKLVEHVYKLFVDKKITAVIDSTFALEDIPDAMQKMHDRKNVGKIVLDPAQQPKPRPPEEDTQKSVRRKSAKEKSASVTSQDEKADEEKK